MKQQLMVATLLAIGGVVTVGAAPATAAPGPCRGNDQLVPATSDPGSHDTNLNGNVCYHDGSQANPNSRKRGNAESYFYDDRL